MPSTPQQTKKSTRSNSTGNITLSDIVALINKTKEELANQLTSELRNVQDSLNTLSFKIDVIEGKLSDLKTKSDDHEKRISEMESTIKDMSRSQDINVDTSAMFTEMAEELQRKSLRMQNIILSGIEEPKDGNLKERYQQDMIACNKILSSLIPNFKCDEISRIGRSDAGRVRRIKIKCRSVKEKFEILQKSKELRAHPNYKHIYINHDQTPREQAEARALRGELKCRREAGEQNLVIYRGKILARSEIQNFQKRF